MATAATVLVFMRTQRLAVEASVNSAGGAQAAVLLRGRQLISVV